MSSIDVISRLTTLEEGHNQLASEIGNLRDNMSSLRQEVIQLTQRIQSIENTTHALQQRNIGVEKHKEWEIGWTRKGSIVVIIYMIALIILNIITYGQGERGFTWWPFVLALVPPVYYLLSTLDLQCLNRCTKRKRSSIAPSLRLPL